jgi:anti-sigma B factor antagonist
VLHVQQQATSGRYVLVRPEGELDALNVSAFRLVLADLAGSEGLVIDLSGVSFIDSVGLGAVVGGVRRARDGGVRVTLACARPALAHILRETGVTKIVSVFDTIDEAVTALEPCPTEPAAVSTVPTSDGHPRRQSSHEVDTSTTAV